MEKFRPKKPECRRHRLICDNNCEGCRAPEIAESIGRMFDELGMRPLRFYDRQERTITDEEIFWFLFDEEDLER